MKVKIIAEIGSNWEGSITKAKKIIYECKRVGADAVKFQIWRAKDLYNVSHPNWKNIKKSELTFDKARKIKEYSDKQGIEFFASAFYPEAVDFLESLNVKKYKIASRTCLFKDPFSHETLTKKSLTRKPVIISMGMGGNREKIKKLFSKNHTIFCYCISEYPTPLQKIKWERAMEYEGFSDHTLGIIAPIIFTILKKQQGAKRIIIEKHIKLKNSKGPDASSSIDTSQFAQMISTIRKIEKLKFKN